MTNLKTRFLRGVLQAKQLLVYNPTLLDTNLLTFSMQRNRGCGLDAAQDLHPAALLQTSVATENICYVGLACFRFGECVIVFQYFE